MSSFPAFQAAPDDAPIIGNGIARSCLFVPGDRPDRFDKAWASAADDVILDLEDAVAAERKHDARAAVMSWLSADRPILIRINALETEWYQRDLELLAHPGVRGLMVPKGEQLADTLVQASVAHGKCLIPIVETALGFHHAAAMARTPAVERLTFGTLDFQVDLGITGDEDALLYFRSHLVLVSRLAGIQPPLDGITVDLSNSNALHADTLRSKRCGFGGKLCIHPSQVDDVNRIFSPSAEELAWAREVVEALERSQGAAVAVGGKMVDRPVILKAERILRTERNSRTRRQS